MENRQTDPPGSDLAQLAAQARSGSTRAAGRLISLLEDDPTRLPRLFAGSGNWPEPGLVLGLTGAPGVGKSTLVDLLVRQWRRRFPAAGVGIAAVDPTSPFTGGAILGDRVRMMRHATDRLVFIRSLASRGHLGGLTLGIRGTLRVMALLGCERVIIETVGVGQSEVEVAGIADLTAILLAPGQGDGVQMLKAGLMEAGDLFVINKADRPGADRLHQELQATLTLAGEEGDQPPVTLTSGVTGRGIDELLDTVEDLAKKRSTAIKQRREAMVREEIRQAILEQATRLTTDRLAPTLDGTIDSILAGETTVEEAASRLLGS